MASSVLTMANGQDLQHKQDITVMEIVTAIITTRNRITLLPRAVGSVLQQTYENIELIIVDDGSTDGTEEYCRGIPAKYIKVGKGGGTGGGHARNCGIKAATGRFVAFLDDDDCWQPHKIEIQVRLMEEKGCDVVYCGRTLELIGRQGGASYIDEPLSDNVQGDMSRRILYTIPSVTSCILFRRDSLIEARMFDEKLKYWQEYELLIRLAQKKTFASIKTPLTTYRINTGDRQRKTNNYHEWRKAISYVYRKHKNLYSRLSKKERIRVRLLANGDARQRCKAAGLWLTSFGLHLKGIVLRRLLRAAKQETIHN